MKVLVIFGVIAATFAAPLPEAEADADKVVVAHHGAVTPYTLGSNLALSPVQYGAHGFVSQGVVAPQLYNAGQVAVSGVAPSAVFNAGTYAVSGVPQGVINYNAVSGVAPGAVAINAGHLAVPAVAPAHVTYNAAPAAVAINAGHVALPAVAPVAPVTYNAAPVAVTHSVAHQVALPPAEVKVPVTTHHVEVPVHQKTEYGTQAYVAGETTTIHKPSLAAPAIAPPSTLLAKVEHNAPEVTLKTQEIPVERHTPKFVDTPYHAGTIVKYTAPEIKEVKVPTPVHKPVAVPHPVPYAAPYPVAQPVAVPQEYHSVNVHQPINVVQQAIPAASVFKTGYVNQAIPSHFTVVKADD